MKVRAISLFIGLLVLSPNLSATQSPAESNKPDDSKLRRQIVGTWVSSHDDGDNPSIGESEYRLDGILVARDFEDESSRKVSEIFEGKWKIENGILIITAHMVFPKKSDELISSEDYIIGITKEKMCLRAVGEQQVYCRTREND